MSDELTQKSASELARMIRSRSASPVEIVEQHLQRIERINPELNAVVTIAEDVRAQAKAAEAGLSDQDSGPLQGVPLTIKDTIETKGLRTTYGSKLYESHIPDHDATVVSRLKRAGAIILGKTNTPEMAIPYETDNPVFGRTNNPHDLSRTSGGSSGGEAAAIAAHLSPAGLGSDLSGSIRVPAHFCGVVGLKPTSGLVPMDGHVPGALDAPLSLGACIGPMARYVDDLELLLAVISGKPAQSCDARQLRVAWYADDGEVPVDAEIRETIEGAAAALKSFGLEVEQQTPPAVAQGSRLWMDLFSEAAARDIRKLYEGREEQAGPGVLALIGKGNNAAQPKPELAERERLRHELLAWMERYPVILGPVGATCAFPHGTRRLQIENQSVSVFRAFSYSQLFNVFGLPAASVPIGQSAKGFPIGVQIVARPFAEHELLAIARLLEEALPARGGQSFLQSPLSL